MASQGARELADEIRRRPSDDPDFAEQLHLGLIDDAIEPLVEALSRFVDLHQFECAETDIARTLISRWTRGR